MDGKVLPYDKAVKEIDAVRSGYLDFENGYPDIDMADVIGSALEGVKAIDHLFDNTGYANKLLKAAKSGDLGEVRSVTGEINRYRARIASGLV